MRPSHLTLFLDPEPLEALAAWGSTHSGEFGLVFGRFTVTDQTGASAPAVEAAAYGLSVVVLPANGFHRSFDYEVGFTEDDAVRWADWLADLGARGIPVQGGPYEQGDAVRYALVGPEDLHGPFFFLLQPGVMDLPGAGPVWRLEGRMDPDALRFWTAEPPVWTCATGDWRWSPGSGFVLDRAETGLGPGEWTPAGPLQELRLDSRGFGWRRTGPVVP